MKPSAILLIALLSGALAARPKEKKTTLEDVERGYVTTKARLSPPPAPKTPAQSPTQFGFVPAKTASDYVQKEPKIVYTQPFYQPKSQYNTIAYSSEQPGTNQHSITQQYQPQPQQYSTPGVQYASKSQPQQEQAYYVPQNGHYLNNYENLQYLADNAIEQPNQQYYNPQQYYYLQQYQAPSTSIQAIIDPKGGLQYIMYIPTYVKGQGEDKQPTNEQLVAYQQPDSPVYSDKPADYTTYTTYDDKATSNYEIGKSSYVPKEEFAIKRQPKSLLDSYVPSLLQIQYYRQAQAHLNGLQDSRNLNGYKLKR